MSVKRYDLGSLDGTWDDNFIIEANNYGGYVTIDDYGSLVDEYNSLQDKYDRLVLKLGDLYQES